jgi:hypothetical protein
MSVERELQAQWLKGIICNHIGHNIAATHFNQRDRMLGLLSTVLAAIVSTAIFTALSSSQSRPLLVTAGVVSLLATVLAAVHSYEKNGELSEQHRQAARQYGTLRREFELLLLENVTKTDTIKAKMVEANARRAEFESSVPTLPQNIFKDALAQADESSVLKLFHVP